MRSVARKQDLPHSGYTAIALLAVASPLYAKMVVGGLSSRYRHKDLEERLEYSPVTRNAWARARATILGEIEDLKREVGELEERLAKAGVLTE
jgi:hypothetical protein